MINLISKFIFCSTLIIGTLITISSSSWIGIWIGLEINLLSFIPLIIDNNNLISTESSIKYFLIQAFASLIFLFTIIIYTTKINFLFQIIISYNENIIINSAIILKLGAAPFHFWFPSLIEGLSWFNSLIILTWQKLAPLIIVSYTAFNNILIIFILFSTFIGRIRGLNQTSLRKILVFSSINHIGWLLISLFYRNLLWIFYFLIYLIINISIIIIFYLFNLFNINQLFSFNNKFPLLKFCFIINFLSLGGLPPFIGFLPKWIVIENLIYTNNLFILFFIVIITLITLFFYIRLTFSAFNLNYLSFFWNISKNINFKILNFNLLINIIISVLLILFLINNFYLF